MKPCQPPLFRNRQFETAVIVTCVRWYLRFSLSLRDLEELMAERGLAVDHTTIWRWTQAYGPEVYRRLSGEVRRKSSTWHVIKGGAIIDHETPDKRRFVAVPK